MNEPDHTRLVALLDNECGAPPAAVAAIQRYGIGALLHATPATVADIIERSGLTAEEIRAGIAGLAAAGRIETDADTIVGVGGLTLSKTPHSLVLTDASVHTWCALDAVGIPVALGLDAEITTTCAHRGTQLQVTVTLGALEGDGSVRLFCPTGPCADVRADFCSAANLFCDTDHLHAWSANNPSVDGQELTPTETAELGRAIWGPHATALDDEPRS